MSVVFALLDTLCMIPTWRGVLVPWYEPDEWRVLYDAYMASGRWARKRTRVLARDGWSCTRCGRHGVLQVHHLSYRFFGREPLGDLVTLCEQCHRDEHGKPLAEKDEDE
jgi:5-methylcytosine-specific restriction endonuclease McrA